MIQPMNLTSMCSKKLASNWVSSLLSTNAWMGAILAICLGTLGLEVRAQSANGFPPNLMTYQGYLVDSNGTRLRPATRLISRSFSAFMRPPPEAAPFGPSRRQ